MKLLLTQITQMKKLDYADKKRKGVKRMKKIGVLIAVAALLLGPSMVFAMNIDPGEPVTISELLSRTTLEITNYDPLDGSVIGSYQKTTSKVKRTRKELGKKDVVTVSEDIQEVYSSWRGSSGLKIDRIEGHSETKESSDGSQSESRSLTTYYYDASGRLERVEDTVGQVGDKFYGTTIWDKQKNETTRSTTKNTYIIKDGQALVEVSKTEGATKKDGLEIQKFTQTTTNKWASMGGKQVLVKSVTVSDSYEVKADGARDNDNKSHTEKTTEYNRDENGYLKPTDPSDLKTVFKITMSGNRVTKNDMGGISDGKIIGFDFTVASDPGMGYYISSDTSTWSDTPRK